MAKVQNTANSCRTTLHWLLTRSKQLVLVTSVEADHKAMAGLDNVPGQIAE